MTAISDRCRRDWLFAHHKACDDPMSDLYPLNVGAIALPAGHSHSRRVPRSPQPSSNVCASVGHRAVESMHPGCPNPLDTSPGTSNS